MTQAIGGGERASNWAYAMMFATMVEKFKAMIPGLAAAAAKESNLPV